MNTFAFSTAGQMSGTLSTLRHRDGRQKVPPTCSPMGRAYMFGPSYGRKIEGPLLLQKLNTVKPGNWGHRKDCEKLSCILSFFVFFPRPISIYWIRFGTGVGVLNSQVVLISQVVLKTGFTVY